MKRYTKAWPSYAAMRETLARRPQHYLEELVETHRPWNESVQFVVGHYFGLAMGPTLLDGPYGGTVVKMQVFQVQGKQARDRMYCHAEVIWTRDGLRLNPIVLMIRAWEDCGFKLDPPMAPGWVRWWSKRHHRHLQRWAWRIRRLGCKPGSGPTPYWELDFLHKGAPALPLMYCAEGFTDFLDFSLYVPGC